MGRRDGRVIEKGDHAMTNYAKISENSASLSSEFGEAIARKWFGDAAVDAMPRYVKGKNKGKLKGFVVWQKVEKGGWVRTGRYDETYGAQGYVETRVGTVIQQRLCRQGEWTGAGYAIGDVVVDLEVEKAREAFQQSKNEETLRYALDADIAARDVMQQVSILENMVLEGIMPHMTGTIAEMIEQETAKAGRLWASGQRLMQEVK